MSNAYTQVNQDTEAAKRGTVPDHLVDTFGASAPDAAKFDVGTSTRQGAQEAQNARRNARPGDYDSKR